MATKKTLNVFVLDDTMLDQRNIKEFLEEYIFSEELAGNIITSNSLTDAKKQLSNLKNSIDLFILDGNINPGFGFDLIPTIKKTNKAAKIIMCSGNSELNQKGVFEKGADTEMTKPDLGRFGSVKAQQRYAEEIRVLLSS